MKKTFRQTVSPGSTWQRENVPDADKVAAKGILTRDSLGWMAAQTPKAPALEHHIDDAGLRNETARLTGEEHKARINALRERLADSPKKARRDFGTARDYDRER